MAVTKGQIIFSVNGCKLPSSNYPIIDATGNRWRLLFDDSTDESCQWQVRLPASYSSTPVAKIQYTMASATSGDVYFNVYIMAVSDGDSQDVDTDSFDSANSGHATVPGTAGYLDEISISLTNFDSGASGDLLIVKLERDADNGSDDASGDAEVRSFSIEYNV